MTELLQGLKSVVEGLTMQTESGQIKWMDHNQFAEKNEKHSWLKSDKEKLDITMLYRLDSKTVFRFSFYLQHDHQISRSYLCVENDDFQGGYLIIAQNNLPELKALEDIVYDRHVKPLIKSYYKSYQRDVAILSSIVNKCGIEVARDFKINTILDSDKKENKGIFGKIFGNK